MNASKSCVRAGVEERSALAGLAPDQDLNGDRPSETDGGTVAISDVLFARVVWSRLIEPGDAVAGALIGALGAPSALDMLAATDAQQQLGRAMRESGVVLPPRTLSAAVARWRPRLDRGATLTDLDRALAAGLRLVAPESPLWPSALNDLGAHAPQLLWMRGDATVLAHPSLAVVGARACTGYGTSVTAELADAAGTAGLAIVSGAAYGIDAVAHRAALATGSATIAILAGGADRAYPAAHASLLDRIAEGGAVCSEMVPGAAPTRWRFLQRNRSIAALAGATLVTEAGTRSGSLNTAGHAAELGRSLGAVPGPVTSATSAGCHRLIREYGATLVSNAHELREFLGLGDAASELLSALAGRQSAVHRRVLDALPLRGSRSAEDVALAAGLTVEEVRGVIAELEMLECVARAEDAPGGQRWRLLRRE